VISPVELSAHQRKLLLVCVVAIAATLIAVLGLDWFHARMALAGGGRAKLDIGLRTVRGCIDQRCETNPVGTESGFGLFATFTYWVGILYAITLAIQAASHVVLGRATHQPMTTIGVMLGVMLLGGLIVCGLLLAPSGTVDKAGARTRHSGMSTTWWPPPLAKSPIAPPRATISFARVR